MSRSGYSEGCEGWRLIMWRGAVNSAIKGKKGQAFLRDMVAALDAVPGQYLIREALVDADGEVCAIGAVGKLRGVDMSQIDQDEREEVAKAFDIAPALAAEIAYLNDEHGWRETGHELWSRMRKWASENIRTP